MKRLVDCDTILSSIRRAQIIAACQRGLTSRARLAQGDAAKKNHTEVGGMTKLFEAKDDIQCFMDQAREAALEGLGFPAMLTIFPVIEVVSEAILYETGVIPKGKPVSNLCLFRYFIAEMTDRVSWLSAPRSVASPSSNTIADKLADVRNGLAHEGSLPRDVRLVNSRAEGTRENSDHPDKWILSTSEFVNAVATTVDDLVKRYPGACIDPDPRHQALDRDVAQRVVTPAGTSASGAR